MPISPTPMPYGFSNADIGSIAAAREGMVRGFESLGKQVREDITRIGTMRQLQSFSQELSAIDPQNELFPQQALSVMAKYPLAAKSEVGAAGINMLGRMHRDWTEAKTNAEAIQLFQTKGGDILRVPKKTGEAEVVYDAEEPAPKPILRSVKGVGLVEVDPTTKETKTLVATPQKEAEQPVFVSQDGTKFYKNGMMILPGGRTLTKLGTNIVEITPEGPRNLTSDSDRKMFLGARLSLAKSRLNRAYSEKSQFAGAQMTPETRPIIEAIDREIVDAEKFFDSVMSEGRGGQTGINSIGAQATPPTPSPAPMVRPAATPLPVGSDLPQGRQQAPEVLAVMPDELPPFREPVTRRVRNKQTGQIETLTLIDGKWQVQR